MNVLEPELVWVEGRCYRFNESAVWSAKQTDSPYQEEYQQDYGDMSNEVCGQNDIQIQLTNDGKHKHVFCVSRTFYPHIIGYRGLIKKKIETDTKTSIHVPRHDDKHENITITGSSRAAVISSRQRLDLIIESSKKKIPFTHFVSIPLNSPAIITKFEAFKSKILSEPDIKSRGITEDIFVNGNKLHLTIGMLRLLSEEEKMEAVDTLAICTKEIIEPILKRKGPVIIKVQGVEYMNDDPSQVSVLYGHISQNDVLQEITDKVSTFFVGKGLMEVLHGSKVKLHMTLMKSSRLLKKDQRGVRAEKFDCRKLLENYKDYLFGELKFKAINISERGTQAEDGHYITLKNINLS